MKYFSDATQVYNVNICDRILENLPFGHKKLLRKLNWKSFKIIFLLIKIKQLLNLLAVKFHTKSLFFLGDMDEYHKTNQCAKKVGFPKYGHIFVLPCMHYIILCTYIPEGLCNSLITAAIPSNWWISMWQWRNHHPGLSNINLMTVAHSKEKRRSGYARLAAS